MITYTSKSNVYASRRNLNSNKNDIYKSMKSDSPAGAISVSIIYDTEVYCYDSPDMNYDGFVDSETKYSNKDDVYKSKIPKSEVKSDIYKKKNNLTENKDNIYKSIKDEIQGKENIYSKKI